MLEHSAMYLNVPPQYEDDTSFFPDFYSRLGPCELQDPVWAKMSALATGVSKKKKKSETKPQAQINKCNNEKRRREQENIYIEELAELISANFADMSSLSVKPDKCAILQETVNQIRSIKQRESTSLSSDPVQQGEVSSSRPTILSNDVYGPLLLEALEGFLFVVNAEGKVEHITENVSNYIKFSREEIFGESIYNIIHLGDHARFSANLMPMTIGWGNDQSTTTTGTTTTNRSRSFSVRFLVKSGDDSDETVEEKQQRINRYELMHISSTQLSDQVTVASEEEGSDSSGPYLLCVASRISHRDKVNIGIEQFTTKLETSGKIIGVDVSGVSSQIAHFINRELMDRSLRDLVPQQEQQKLHVHLRDTLSAGQSTSAVYRLQIGPERYVQVQTKSKLFKSNPHVNADTDFIMATHSIIGEYDAIGPTDPGGGGGSSNVGGPLMTSVVNGTPNGTVVPVSGSSDSSAVSTAAATLMNTSSNNPPSFASSFSIDQDFSFDIFPTTTFDLETGAWPPEPRPDSRQSAAATPVSTPTPRTPSNGATAAVAAAAAQSPLASFVTQPSPSTPASNQVYVSGGGGSGGTSFPFSPLSDHQNYGEEPHNKDTKVMMDEAPSIMAESGRLRNLLTKPTNVADSSANSGGDTDNRNKHKILKGLLNQQDEDESTTRNEHHHRASPRGSGGGGGMSRGQMPNTSPKTSPAAGGNDMLLKLLNEKSDDDDLEAKAGVKTKSELLQQLLKNTTESRDNKEDDRKNNDQVNEDSLLRSLGFSGSPSPPNGEPGRARKRPSDDRDESSSGKRCSSDGSQVSSSGTTTKNSKLFEKNKMLASLLAKQPNVPPPTGHLPASIITATPQEVLPRVPTDPSKKNPMQSRAITSNAQQIQQQQRAMAKSVMAENNMRLQRQMSNNANYANSMMAQHPNNIHHHQQQQRDAMNFASLAAASSTVVGGSDLESAIWADNNNLHNNDKMLSDILDQVMDIVQEGRNYGGDGHQANNFGHEMSEKMAINIIQKSLMQCESVVKSPSSPTISMAGTPPAYSSAAITTQTNQNRGGFPPPPNYHQPNMMARVVNRAVPPQYSLPAGNQLMLQQRKQQEEDKRRLLQQQRQQELLIPSNASAAEMNSATGMQSIDSLLNNTVAPNVTLQRSSSLPEAQLSPGYGGQLTQQQKQRLSNQQQQQQQPYSPHAQLVSPIGGQQGGFAQQNAAANYQQAGSRLSPQFNQQMAPRQAYLQQQGQQGQNWQQAQVRLSLQNPMLNAQLTRTPNQGQQTQQSVQQRSLNSPGTVTSRHSPYPQPSDNSFAPPTSPNSAAFNQNQYLRLQRANSVPTATTQLPGGLGSPRPYGREHHPHPYPPPQMPQQPPPNAQQQQQHLPHHPSMMYQQDSSQYCYEQSGLQLGYNGADRGRAPPPHLPPGVVSGSGPTSEYVRQELRAVVGARTGQQQPQQQQQPSRQQQQQQQQQSQLLSPPDLEAFGLTYEMNPSEYYGGGSAR